MVKKNVALAALLIGMAGAPSTPSVAQPAQVPPRCLHGPSELSDQRIRREQALRVAQEINAAETLGPLLIPGKPRTYKPLDQLPNVPPTPDGFRVQFNTDGAVPR
jgi:hypothetical protein